MFDAMGLPGYCEFQPLGHMLRSVFTQNRSLGVATARKRVSSLCLQPACRRFGSVHSCFGTCSKAMNIRHMGSGSSVEADFSAASRL